jgi:hypothetical protein
MIDKPRIAKFDDWITIEEAYDVFEEAMMFSEEFVNMFF